MFSGSLQYEQIHFYVGVPGNTSSMCISFRLPSEAISMTLKPHSKHIPERIQGNYFFNLLHLFFYLVAFLCFCLLFLCFLKRALDHPIEIRAEVNIQ